MKSTLDYRDPFRQLAFLGLTCLIIQLMALVVLTQSDEPYGHTIWIISGTFFLLFAMMNAIVQLGASDVQRYISRSLWSFLLMGALTIGLAWGLTVGEESSFERMRVIYLVIALCYVIFVIIAYMMRKIMDYAQQQDQEHRT